MTSFRLLYVKQNAAAAAQQAAAAGAAAAAGGLQNIGGPPGGLANNHMPKISVIDLCEKIKDEFNQLQAQCHT